MAENRLDNGRPPSRGKSAVGEFFSCGASARSLAVPAALAVAALLLMGATGVAAWRDPDLSYLLLIAAANNVDNLGARIAYSLEGVKVNALLNLWIAVITFVFSAAAAFLGEALSGTLGVEAAALIAAAVLAGLGVAMILQARRAAASPSAQPRIAARRLGFMEGTLLGVALSLNNIGGGLGAGMMGLDPFLLGLFSAVVSFLALWAGNHLADWLVRRDIAKKAGVVGGLLLIAIGVKQLF